MIVILGFMYFIPLLCDDDEIFIGHIWDRLLFDSQIYKWADILLNDARNHWNSQITTLPFSGVLSEMMLINHSDDVNLFLLIVINCLIYFDTFFSLSFGLSGVRPVSIKNEDWLWWNGHWQLYLLLCSEKNCLLFRIYLTSVQLFDRLFLHLKMVKKKKKMKQNVRGKMQVFGETVSGCFC